MKNHKQKIGLWIDLTNTARFYDKQKVSIKFDITLKERVRGQVRFNLETVKPDGITRPKKKLQP